MHCTLSPYIQHSSYPYRKTFTIYHKLYAFTMLYVRIYSGAYTGGFHSVFPLKADTLHSYLSQLWSISFKHLLPIILPGCPPTPPPLAKCLITIHLWKFLSYFNVKSDRYFRNPSAACRLIKARLRNQHTVLTYL